MPSMTPQLLPLHPYRVTTAAGTFDVMAATMAAAIDQANYLAGTPRPPAVLSCLRQGDW